MEKKRRVVISASGRVSQLPAYLFAEIDRQKKLAASRGLDLIDFGIGDPDQPTPPHVVREAAAAVAEPSFHRYPVGRGSGFFIEAVGGWMEREFGVRLGRDIACGALIGSKEGLSHVPSVFCNPGDIVLVPNPGYPVYRSAAILACADPFDVPLLEANGFLPDVEKLDRGMVRRARAMYLNYPNNPTGAVISFEQMHALVDFARREDILLISDNSYSHVRFDGNPPLSFLQIEGADEVCLEFHSLSKTFNMTGWRVGFVVGGTHLVETFMNAKENMDSGVFTAVQKAAEAALGSGREWIDSLLATYSERRALLAGGLRKQGWHLCESEGTFYLWMKVPVGYDSMGFTRKLITSAGIVVTPGSGFGSFGEGYVRFALTVPAARISEAIGRLELLSMPGRRMGRKVRKDRGR
ncbi:aminotransferase class I/II-fold pyridoxal phosphate-dependent enzyme [Candidatus Fermentibacterales bacterium]|nr:aminotransferase class I/II-fold pyridoxal phosphate-dependent enzyme [Candidatus Fermentibacterales bacterium]